MMTHLIFFQAVMVSAASDLFPSENVPLFSFCVCSILSQREIYTILPRHYPFTCEGTCRVFAHGAKLQASSRQAGKVAVQYGGSAPTGE